MFVARDAQRSVASRSRHPNTQQSRAVNAHNSTISLRRSPRSLTYLNVGAIPTLYCLGNDTDNPSTHHAMQRRVLQDEKAASRIIAGKLHQFLHDAADITGMTYRCKLTGYTLACVNSKDIRLSWVQDGSAENLHRLAWMFYYYGTEIHKLGRSTLTHGEWVERKVMTAMNIAYVHLADLPLHTMKDGMHGMRRLFVVF